jgi:hypothetical protein
LELILNGGEAAFKCQECDHEFPIIDDISRFLKFDEEILEKLEKPSRKLHERSGDTNFFYCQFG